MRRDRPGGGGVGRRGTAPERAAAELPEAKVPAVEPLGQLVGVTDSQRLQEHERFLLPHSIVARLRFSDLHCTHAQNTLEGFDENLRRKGLARQPH